MKPPGTHWTKEELETLRRLLEEGRTCREIAEVLQRSTKSVQNARKDHLPGTPPFRKDPEDYRGKKARNRHHWTEEELTLLYRYWRRIPMRQLTAMLGMASVTVTKKVRELGITRQAPQLPGTEPLSRQNKWWTEEENRMLAMMVRDGYTYPEMASALGRSEYSVRQHKRDYLPELTMVRQRQGE